MKHDSKMHRQKVWYDTKEHNTALKNHILRVEYSKTSGCVPLPAGVAVGTREETAVCE